MCWFWCLFGTVQFKSVDAVTCRKTSSENGVKGGEIPPDRRSRGCEGKGMDVCNQQIATRAEEEQTRKRDGKVGADVWGDERGSGRPYNACDR